MNYTSGASESRWAVPAVKDNGQVLGLPLLLRPHETRW